MGKRIYSEEFKLEALRLLRERGVSLSQVARELGIKQQTLHRWRSVFPGREVLRFFVDFSRPGISYEKFRDLILARMCDADYHPIGMAKVLNAILADV